MSGKHKEKPSDKYKFLVFESQPLPNENIITKHDLRDHFPEDFPERIVGNQSPPVPRNFPHANLPPSSVITRRQATHEKQPIEPIRHTTGQLRLKGPNSSSPQHSEDPIEEEFPEELHFRPTTGQLKPSGHHKFYQDEPGPSGYRN